MKFGFIAKHRGIWPADWLCGALGVSRGGFYAWLTRPRSRRSRSNEELGAQVWASFLASDRTYGARRVWHDMLAEGTVRAASGRAIDAATSSQSPSATASTAARSGERQVAAVAPNVLDRSFEAPAPNRKWIADFTYVWTVEGWLYVAAVIDLFSGWSMSAAMTAQLVTDALVMAIWRRGKPDALLHHSDPRQPIHQRAVPEVDGRSRRRLLDEPFSQRLGQCGDGKLLLVAQDRADNSQNISNQGGTQGRRVRLH